MVEGNVKRVAVYQPRLCNAIHTYSGGESFPPEYFFARESLYQPIDNYRETLR